MKGKILFVVGLGAGYVLGARAGRERYEQIRRAALNVWNQPQVQQGVDTVKDFAKTRVGDLSNTVLDGVKSRIGNARKSSGPTSTTSATQPSTTSTPSKPTPPTGSATNPATTPSEADTGDGPSPASGA